MKEWIVILVWAILEQVLRDKEKARAFAVRHLGEDRVYEIEHNEGMFG